MRRLRFWLNLIVLLTPLFFLGIGGVRLVQSVFHYLNSNKRLAGTMSAEATRALGREVRVGDVHITGNLWSLDAANRVDLFDIFVANGKTAASGAFARARRLTVWYNLKQVIANDQPLTPLVNEVQVENPTILLTRDTKGHWNYQDLIQAPTTNRSFTDKFSFSGGTLFYHDQDFPHPAGVVQRPLDTRLDRLTGILLIRPDKSVAFDVTGLAQSAIMRDFHVTGTAVSSPLRVQTRLIANQVVLPAFAERLLPPVQARITSGRANVNIGVLYIPPIGTPARRFDTKALNAHGTVQVFDGAATGKQIGAPLDHLNGTATFTTDTILGSLRGNYAGTPVSVDGSILGFTLPPLAGGQHATTPPTPPTVSMQGAVKAGDWTHLSRLTVVQPLLDRLPQNVRMELRKGKARGDVQFHVIGPLDNLTATATAQFAELQYGTYRGENLDVRAFYDGHVLHTSLKGRYAKGEAVVRGQVAFDETGAFEAEAHGRNLHLDSLGAPIPQRITGTGQLDFAIRGQRGRTPNITAQAQADRITVNGQSLQKVYAKADTVGPDLVVRTLHAEDAKGLVLASGTVGLKTKALNLIVDADELDFGAIAKAVIPAKTIEEMKQSKERNAQNAGGIDLADVHGYGYLRGRLTGTLEKPALGGRLYAFGLQTGKVEIDKVTLSDFQLSKDLISLKGLASKYPGELALSGKVYRPFSKSPDLELNVAATQMDVATLAQLAGVDTSQVLLAGTLSTDNIALRGTPSALQIPDLITVNLQNASINGLPIRNAALTARYQPEGIYIKDASAQIADGMIVSSGWLPFNGPLDFTAHGSGLDIQALEEAGLTAAKSDQAPPIVKGELAFDARLTGTMQKPVVTTDSISAQNLLFNNFKIGSLKAQAEYADKRVRINNLVQTGPAPQDGTITLNGLEYDTETKQIQTAKGEPVRLNSIPVERLRDLVYNFIDVNDDNSRKVLNDLREITGPISVTAAVNGTLEQPVADVAWSTTGIKAKNYEITAFTGSALIDKDKVIYPSPSTPDLKIRLESPYAHLESPVDPLIKDIRVEFDRPGYDGRILTDLKPDAPKNQTLPADINVSNINLEFLQEVLGKTIARKIAGTGTLDITADGRTKFPQLRLSANLRDVAYSSPEDIKAPPILLNRVYIDGTVKEGLVQIDSLRAIKNDAAGKPHESTATASLKGFTYQSPFIPDDAGLTVMGTLPLPFIGAAVPGVLQDSSEGAITVNATFLRLLNNPTASGVVAINAPQVRIASLRTGLKDVVASLSLKNDRLTVDSFAGHTEVFDKASLDLKKLTVRKGQPNPKKQGSDIVLTGSIPLGLSGETTKGANDGLTLRVDNLYFDETPLPNSSSGSAHGSLNLNLRVVGSVKEPTLTGRAVLYDALLKPSNEEKPGGFVFPILPNFDLALSLDKNVHISSPQLDARLSTEKDILAHGNLLSRNNDLGLEGTIQISNGTLKLPTSRFKILPGASLHVSYPTYESGLPVLGLNVDLKARGRVVATSLSGVRKNYEVTVTARGPLTGDSTDPITGRSTLALNFETSPNDLASSQQQLTERLAGALIGVGSLDQAGHNPGQAFTNVLSNVFTGSVIPGFFDRAAASLGFEELSIAYDPVQRLTLNISRHLFGPLYVSYFRTLSSDQERYDLKFSFRFRDRYQLSYDVDEQHTQKILLEGVWRF